MYPKAAPPPYDASCRFKAGIIPGLNVCGNAGHDDGRAYDQHKASRHQRKPSVIVLRRRRFSRSILAMRRFASATRSS